MPETLLIFAMRHDTVILAGAVLISLFAAASGLALGQRAWRSSGAAQGRWIILAGCALGLGVWATHFVAALSFDPGFRVGYVFWPTVWSLVISILGTILAFRLGVWRAPVGGAIFGLGAVSMHYAGMGAMIYDGSIDWDSTRILVSVVLPTVLGSGCFMLARRGSTRLRKMAVPGLAGTVCLMHFTAMSAADMTACVAVSGLTGGSAAVLALAVGLGTLFLLSLPLIALFFVARDNHRDIQEKQRLRELANATQEGLLTVRDGIITNCNIAFRILTAFDTGTVLADVMSASTLAILRNSHSRPVRCDITAHDGTVIAVAATLRPLSLGHDMVEVISLRDLRDDLAVQAKAEGAAKDALAAERRFRFLVQSLTDYTIYMLTPDGHIANWNVGAQRNKGYLAAEIVGRHFSIFFDSAEERAVPPSRMLHCAMSTGKYEGEGWQFRKDGHRYRAQILLEPMHDDDGQHIGFVNVTHDITRKREDAGTIARISRNLHVATENMIQGIALFDATGRLVLSNARLVQLLGGADPDGISIEDFAQRLMRNAHTGSDALQTLYCRGRDRHGPQCDDQLMLDLKDGRILLVVHRAIPEGGWVSTFEDVTERTRSERQIVHMARHDVLTGLPNRASFQENIGWSLDSQREGVIGIAVLGIDLDRFKEINDHLGHAVGDEVLTILAQRVTSAMVGDEFAARFGGDEFAAFKPYRHPSEVQEFADRLMAVICSPVNIQQHKVSVGASIGIALYPEDGHTAEKLLSNSDMAMYRAKRSITEKICYYQADMDEAYRSRRQLARDLWTALDRNEMFLHYQIQKSVSTGETTGFEVLLRWNHPERGNVSPADFIPVAEECGAILPIGEWVLRTACQQAARFVQKSRIAVNLSPVQLGNRHFVATLQAILEETGLEPDRLELEVTETSIIANKERTLNMLAQIKALGVTIAIDDFGTGYSSLETLRSFAFDKIKLDRSFVHEVDTNRQAKAIIRAILALGRSLEVPVLAEGVETIEQLHLLRNEGCDQAQGYYLGRPGILECVMPDMVDAARVA
ncbi:EAL domain-containing protein [Falsirhodobacter sp. alg1]|uniref:bifunctional diguanylate cyclase/phosphodiesterase n=1 Tax=Falsirhodobacter sp. alg1 TaxID=1472418 RepID=UPI000787B982|nr:EAL domain-containing protein [Falsirhodobacter sp. alg1]